ncbi:MAG: hypothetical protein MRJ96_00510 [Nitrospirales bacterium]|nr:hypothetical protein [Nitrospira sp.]MDR4499921.1 hypothetical protein [Nitrospirales bacterium]
MAKLALSTLLLGTLLILTSCSSRESRGDFDTLLCWLRPSCLPSQQSSSPPQPPPPPPKSLPSKQAAPPKLTPPCQTTLTTTVTATAPSVTISYVEPTTQANGNPLKNLAKTTIYHNNGDGYKKTKDVPASSPEGGGTVTETLSFTIAPGKSIETTICVTATNSSGQEG